MHSMIVLVFNAHDMLAAALGQRQLHDNLSCISSPAPSVLCAACSLQTAAMRCRQTQSAAAAGGAAQSLQTLRRSTCGCCCCYLG
jgi:hypothetical protein